MIQAAATIITQSLRVQNPSVRVANSIYNRADNASSAFARDVMSVVAPSELEVEFDDMIINSQAYRRAMAHAQAKITPPSSQDDAALGDLIDLTDNFTMRQEDAAPVAPPSALQELQDLVQLLTRDHPTEGRADQQRTVATEASLAASSQYQAIFEALELSGAAFSARYPYQMPPFPSSRSPRQSPRYSLN